MLILDRRTEKTRTTAKPTDDEREIEYAAEMNTDNIMKDYVDRAERERETGQKNNPRHGNKIQMGNHVTNTHFKTATEKEQMKRIKTTTTTTTQHYGDRSLLLFFSLRIIACRCQSM